MPNYAPNSMTILDPISAIDRQIARGKVVKRAIELAGSQHQLAKALNVKGSYISKWKNGLIGPEFFQIVKTYVEKRELANAG